MKRTVIFLILVLFFFSNSLMAQTYNSPVEYMEQISKTFKSLTKNNLSYLSALSHGKSARKIEKRRAELINNIYNSIAAIRSMPAWQGDREYRDTTVSYLKLMATVFNEDYSKIVNMEEIAEQSYDAMEAYLLAKQKANQKLDNLSELEDLTEKKFALKYKINLIQTETDLSLKSKQAAACLNHYDSVYLIFFKPFKQEMYLTDAISKNDVNAIEQNRNTLLKYVEEGQAKLKTIKSFPGDPSLMMACRSALQFYQQEAQKTQSASNYFINSKNFDKLKKSFETKASPTKQEVDEYNGAVKNINKEITNFNKTLAELNQQRAEMLNNWNNAVSAFFDNNMPVYR